MLDVGNARRMAPLLFSQLLWYVVVYIQYIYILYHMFLDVGNALRMVLLLLSQLLCSSLAIMTLVLLTL